MKTKLFISILFYLYVTTSIGQTDSILKKKQLIIPKWQIGVNVNSVEPITEAGYDIYFGQPRLFNDFDHQKKKSTSFGLNISYQVKEQWGVRVLGKLTKYKVEETFSAKDRVTSGPSSSDYLVDTGTVKQSNYVLSPGIFWNFSYKRLKFYCGLQIVYKNFGPVTEHLIYRKYDTQTDQLLDHRYYDIELEGGYSIGAGPFIGFSFNIFKGISLGGEFSSSYSYYNTGGELKWTETRIYPTAYSDFYTNKHTYKANKFSSIISSINLAYSF